MEQFLSLSGAVYAKKGNFKEKGDELSWRCGTHGVAATDTAKAASTVISIKETQREGWTQETL